ncbi:hypothetical protein Tco_0820342 [Tanacetum coccineum]|uniref:Uncharacterized protein n=1 Tax=Tanacetum coccineum TaxID=301880 RepID=A0ABQ4YZI4_9ASTR
MVHPIDVVPDWSLCPLNPAFSLGFWCLGLLKISFSKFPILDSISYLELEESVELCVHQSKSLLVLLSASSLSQKTQVILVQDPHGLHQISIAPIIKKGGAQMRQDGIGSASDTSFWSLETISKDKFFLIQSLTQALVST